MPKRKQRHRHRPGSRLREDAMQPCPDCIDRDALNPVGLPRMIGVGQLRGASHRIRSRRSASGGCATCSGTGHIPRAWKLA
jgi:hypothetical protein